MQNDTPAPKFLIGEQPSDAKVTTAPDALQTAANSNSKEPPQAPAPSNDKIFALIIGIGKYDCYPKYPDLPGAASDADKIYKFVRDFMHVPEKNIDKLYNERATREAIIQSFRSLETNPEIIRGEAAIIIYYAGHGATAPKPKWKDWDTLDNTIEMLCPVDMTPPELDPHTGKVDVKVEGIPDRTISCLLRDLSTEKGNNITLILDCCHSAGINRGAPPDPSAIPRQILGPQIISPECDSDIHSRKETTRKSDEAPNGSGFSGSLWDSHILLAACSRHESAWEVQSAGVFTKELLRVMRGRSLTELTYRSLMDNLNMPKWTNQTPHREGNAFRRLFDPSGRIGDGSMIVCYRTAGEDGQPQLILGAGDSLGITDKSVYLICSTDLPGAPSLGTAVVEQVTREDSSSLSPDPKFFINNSDFHVGYARLVEASRPDLLAYGQDLDFLKEVLSDDQCPTQLEVPVDIAPDQNEADLYLIVEGDNVSFDRGKTNSYYKKDEDPFPRMERNRLFRLIEPRLTLTSKKDIAEVRRIINQYANFTYHLTNRSKRALTDFVSIKMHKLECAPGEFNLTAVGNDLLDNREVVEVDVEVSLRSDRRPKYGFTIYNRRNIELYAYLFYFDASNLQIDCWYQPQMGAKNKEVSDAVDSCLKKKGSELTLGFGNGGMKPITFTLPKDQSTDICCFKFFVAVKPLDLGSIEQSIGLRRGAEKHAFELPPDDSWASLVIPVLQRATNRLGN